MAARTIPHACLAPAWRLRVGFLDLKARAPWEGALADHNFYTAEPISEKRSMTPEGFMVCHDVTLARTGTMPYGAGETPVRVNDQGFALIHRDAEEVFKPASMYSINGKPVVDDHPFYDVTPLNYRQLAMGHVMAPRRGEGSAADLLVADVLITDPGLMKKVQDGKVEVSCGYIANYVEDGVGRGRQVNIRYNHLAVVDKGRCGERCRIGDRHPGPVTGEPEDELQMSNRQKTKNRVWDSASIAALRLRLPLAAQVAFDAEMKKMDEEEDGDGTKVDASGHTINIHNHPVPVADDDDEDDDEKKKKTEDRMVAAVTAGVLDALKKGGLKFKDVGEGPNSEAAGDPADENKKLEGDIDLEAPPGTTGDRAARLHAAVRDTAALANSIAPGISLPTFDAAAMAEPRRVLDGLCALRRQALKVALVQPTTVGLATSLVRDGATVDKLSCADVRGYFRSVAESVRARATHDAANRGLALPPGRQSNAGSPVVGKVKSLAELNEANAKIYGGK